MDRQGNSGERGNTNARLVLKTAEAAELLSISDRALWSLTAPRGPIPCVRLGRSVRYSLAALQRYVETGRA